MCMFFTVLSIGAVIVLGIAALVMFISVFVGVPFVPTHRKQAELMMQLVKIGPGTKVIDLGSGAGRLLFLAAGRGADTIGYELNPFLCWWTSIVAIIKKMSRQVEIKCQSIYNADVSEADVVLAFLFPEPMKRLGPKLFAEMRPGALIASYAFSISGHEPIKKEQGIFVYRV